MKKLSALLSVPSADLVKKVEDLREAGKKLAKDLEKTRRGQNAASVDEVLSGAGKVGGIALVAHRMEGSVNDLRAYLDRIKPKAGDAVVVLGGTTEGRVDVVVYCSPTAISKGLQAGAIAQAAAKVLGGGGGGKPDSAQAGGKDPAKLPEAVAAALAAAQVVLSSKAGGAA